MKGKRKDIFDQFSNEERAILFHYDVISEGIDLPGTTAILPLRELGEIKIVQAVGRALRISTNDRAALKNKLISVGKSEGWQKPFGWVILPWFGDDNSGAIDRVCDWVYALRSANFNYDVERMTVVEQPKGGINPPIDDLSPDLDRNDKTTGIDMTLFNIDKKVKHELEAEEAMYKEKLEPIKKVKPGFLAKCRGKVT